jgi:hypothetical protein
MASCWNNVVKQTACTGTAAARQSICCWRCSTVPCKTGESSTCRAPGDAPGSVADSGVAASTRRTRSKTKWTSILDGIVDRLYQSLRDVFFRRSFLISDRIFFLMRRSLFPFACSFTTRAFFSGVVSLGRCAASLHMRVLSRMAHRETVSVWLKRWWGAVLGMRHRTALRAPHR